MPSRNSVLVVLASSMGKLLSAWWNVDRIRVPHSRRADCGEESLDAQNREVESARTRRGTFKVRTTDR